MGNSLPSGNAILPEVVALPAGWTGSVVTPAMAASLAPVDAMLSVQRRGAADGTVRVAAKSRAAALELGRVDAIKDQIRDARAGACVDTLFRDIC